MIERKLRETLELRINGVNLRMELDYDEGRVSFVNRDGGKQHFIFAEREVEYLGGWLKIYDALRQATMKADKLLKEEETKREKQEWDNLTNIWNAIQEKK